MRENQPNTESFEYIKITQVNSLVWVEVLVMRIANICQGSTNKSCQISYAYWQSTVSQLAVKNYILSAVGTRLAKQVTVILSTAYASGTAVNVYVTDGSSKIVGVASVRLSLASMVASECNALTRSTLLTEVAGKAVANPLEVGVN